MSRAENGFEKNKKKNSIIRSFFRSIFAYDVKLLKPCASR